MDNKEKVHALALSFTRIIRDWYTTEEIQSVIERNRVQTDGDICHSHDYHDANEAMFAAFVIAFGREPQFDGDWRPDVVVWNDAWDLAKACDFLMNEFKEV